FFSHRSRAPTSSLFPYTTLFRSWVGGTFALNTIDQSEPTQFLKVGDVIGGTDFKIVKFTGKHERDQYGTKVDVSELLLEHKATQDRKSTRLNSSHVAISYAVFCL